MSKLNFCDFPHNRDAPQNATVSDENAFECPAEEMCERKHIEMLIKLFEIDLVAVDAVLLVHVDMKVLKVGVKPVEDAHDRFETLEHQEEQEHQIQY